MKKNSKKAEKIKKKRNPKPSISPQPVKQMKCPQCKKLVPEFKIENIRGQIKCIKCHIEDLWCYAEENRRTQKRLVDELTSVDWKGNKD